MRWTTRSACVNTGVVAHVTVKPLLSWVRNISTVRRRLQRGVRATSVTSGGACAVYQTQPLGYAASPVGNLFSSLISHRLSTNHFMTEDQFWLSARGTSNGARLLLVIEGNLLHVTMLFVQCSLLLLLLTTMLVLCTAVNQEGVQTLLKVVQISRQVFLTWLYRPQLHTSFSISRLTTRLKLCMPIFTDVQSRLQKVLPCPVCLQSVPRRHSVVLYRCKHVLCKSCLIQYLESEAGDSRLPRCVMPQCQRALDMEQCQLVLHQHQPVSLARPPDCHVRVKASLL